MIEDIVKRLLAIGLLLIYPVIAITQEAVQQDDSAVYTTIVTWVPFLFLIFLWWLFARRMNVFGKGGYRDYMRTMQERTERIESHLADIATSLRKIADKGDVKL